MKTPKSNKVWVVRGMCKYHQKITKCHVGLLGCFSSLLQPDNVINVIKSQWQMFIRCITKKNPNKIYRRHSKTNHRWGGHLGCQINYYGWSVVISFVFHKQ